MSILLRCLHFALGRPVVPATLFGVWLVILYQVSNRIPKDMPDMLVPQQDKVLHFVFFLGGGATLAASLRLLTKLQGVSLMVAVGLVMGLLGALDEYNQQFIPGRSGLSPADWTADVSGALAGSWFLILLVRRLQEKAEWSRRRDV